MFLFLVVLSHPFLGERVGEAKNPGPGPDPSLKIMVTNPTAINGKSDTIASLDADVVVLSETGATEKTLTMEKAKLHKKKINSIWGDPVEPQLIKINGQPSVRGRCLGVGVISRAPLKKPFSEVPPEFLKTGRYMETWVKVGHMDLLIVGIYGVPECVPEHYEMNGILLSWAIQRTSKIRASVTGSCGAKLQDLGFVDLLMVARDCNPEDVQPTCRNKTFHDTILLKGPLLQHYERGYVKQHFLFDSHVPFTAVFQVPKSNTLTAQWTVPKS